jgi:hypothetical protein
LGDIADQRLFGSETHEQIIAVEGANFNIFASFIVKTVQTRNDCA